jgi:hypothetical protein
MNANGMWETADGVPIEVDTKRKIARSRLRKWARSVKARPYALHWLEEHAKRVEEKRIAEVDIVPRHRGWPWRARLALDVGARFSLLVRSNAEVKLREPLV